MVSLRIRLRGGGSGSARLTEQFLFGHPKVT
jgi:hypothetical protein